MAVEKVCESCGAKFNVPPRRAESVRFCSRKCKTAAGREALNCATCGTLFERVVSASQGKAAYCSTGCYHAGLKGKPKATPEARPRYFKTCETCKTEFRVTKTRADTARFCSRACQGASAAWKEQCSEVQQGDKHWRWTGGKYKFQSGYVRDKRRVKGTDAYFEHRRVILDAMLHLAPTHPFLIVLNGKTMLNPLIEVHHIDRDRGNNALSNLLAITKDAHAQLHHRNRKPEPWECWPPNPSNW